MNKDFAIQSESLRYALRLSLLSLSLTFGLHILLFSNIISPLDTVTNNSIVMDCSNVEVCNSDSSNCSGIIQLRPLISSDCTPANGLSIQYKIDLNNDGTFDQLGYSTNQGPVYPFPNPDNLPVRPFLASFPQADGTYPVGQHVIYWEVLDSCGMQADCQQAFVVKDCTPPIARCLIGIVTVPPINWVGLTTYILKANDFDQQSEDNCTAGENLTFSFSQDSTDRTDTLYCFIDVGDTLVYKEVYVWDEAGNYSICGAHLYFFGCWIEPARYNLTGEIYTEEGQYVTSPVKLNLEQPPFHFYENIITDGEFVFYNLEQGDPVELKLSKNDNFQNGVTTFDLVLISKHILGINALNSPYKIIAADVNHSGTVTTLDMLEIRKMVLGISDTFTNNTSWRFVPEDYVFSNPQTPLQDSFPEVYYNPSFTMDEEVNFIAIKTGDVNNSARPSLQAKPSDRSVSKVLPLMLEDRYLEAGEAYIVPLRLEEGEAFYGMQFELGVEGSKVELLGLQSEVLGVGEEHFWINAKGDLRFSWNNATPVAGGSLLELTLRAKRGGWLSEAIQIKEQDMLAELYMEDETGTVGNYPLQLEFRKQEIVASMSQCTQDTIPPEIMCDTEVNTIPCKVIRFCDYTTDWLHLIPSDFVIESTDNCTAPENLTFSFSSDPTDDLISHNVWDYGFFSQEIYVWDEAGNFATCAVGYVLNICETYRTTIDGEVFTEDLEPVSSFRSSLDSGAYCSYFDTTNTGSYSYSVAGSAFELRIEKNDYHKNGVSTFDLITISRHIIGVDTLDSPYKRIAADINRSSTITGLDMLLLRRLILDLDTAFTKNTSWRFLRSSYDFPNPEIPFNAPFAEPDILNADYYTYYLNENYIGIKIGDVTGNVDPNAFTHTEIRNNNPNLHFITPDQQLQAGQTYRLPIYTKTDHRLLGFQFTLDLAPEALTITNISPGQLETLNREHFGWQNRSEGQLTTSWHQAEGLQLNSSEPLFYMEVACQQNCMLSEVMDLHSEEIAAEMYTQEEEGKAIKVSPLELQFQQSIKALYEIAVYPNPTTGWLNIQSAEPVTEIELLSINGQKMRHWQSSNNINTINISNLPSGFYLLRLSTKEERTIHLKLQKM